MPKKKGNKKNLNADFTINDSANALKPVSRVKKAIPEVAVPEQSWDEIQDDDLDIVEQLNSDGTKNFIYKKKKTSTKSESENIDDSPVVEYPEILWYLISQYLKPEQIGTFALINRTTYGITKRESFWRMFYNRYCQNHPRLPERLRIENCFKKYGLQQRVIRALNHTYPKFSAKCMQEIRNRRPHSLTKRRCVNVWYYKDDGYWAVFFKLKKVMAGERKTEHGFIEELERIDANPEKDTQVLQVNCLSFNDVPPVMGMNLSLVGMVLSSGLRQYKLQLGFHSSQYNLNWKLCPECIVVLDKVIETYVYDWWHPMYPHYDNTLLRDEESLPVLKKDFFATSDGDL